MYRLALDLGTNSIGWTALELKTDSKAKSPALTGKILDIGVRIYTDGREAQKGTPLNEARRNARQMRRQRDRKIRRKKAMLKFLVNNKLMPFDREEQQVIARLDPYALRAAALERKLKPFELGRILMQFSIRRGFKSGRKGQQSENTSEREGMLGGIQYLESELQGLTLGQWLLEQRVAGKPVRFKARLEKSKATYPFFPSREMYEHEFAGIRNKQEKYFKEINWDRLHWLIFFQRPLKRPERGRCQFYTEEDRGYRAFVSAHRFRILQEINNLRYYNEKNIEEKIPVELKLKLFEALNSQKSLTFNKIRKLLGKNYTGSFNLEDSKRSELKGNETSVDFRKPEFFGQLWDELEIRKQDEIIEELMIEDDEKVISDMLKILGLSNEQIKKISGHHFPVGTTMLSSRFMIECSDIMLKEWLSPYKAIEKMGLHHSKGEKREIGRSLPYYGKILVGQVSGAKGENYEGKKGEHFYSIEEKRYGRIANPTVHIAMNQLRKLVNALIRRYGNPDQIVIEVNRELKQSKARKDEILREQAKNQKANERIRNELTELGLLKISSEDIKKYKLWEELASEGIARRCPYCGKTISAKQLITGTVEIDHILPYSRTLLNSRDNLTVAHRECNQKKKDYSPFEAFGNNPKGFDWDKIIELTAKLPFNKRRKFYPDAMKHFRDEEGGFIDRQITDTAYLSKAGKDYLSAICDSKAIWVSTGRLTAMLRGFWGFNTLLNRGHDTWFKNRSDHRHHALDALVIGLCDRRIIAEAARINSGRLYGEINAPPCPIKRQDIEERLKSIIVSYKVDRGKEGKLYAETALAKHSYLEQIGPADLEEKEINRIVPKTIQEDITLLVKKESFRKAKVLIKSKYKYLRVFRDKWVTRAPLTSLSERDLTNISDPVIRTEILEFVESHPPKSGQKLQDVLAQFSEEKKIYSIRFFHKDQVPVHIEDNFNKAYMPSDYYKVDIWRIPQQNGKYKYEGVFISRPEAMRQLSRRHEHPAAKLIVSLCKNDIIHLSKKTDQEFCRIAGFSTTQNKIDIRPLYASDTIAAWKKDTHINLCSSFWPSEIEGQYFKSINALFNEFEIKLVKITVDGRLIYR
ncbi:MAG: type II CRISPR RNA-guided endonuclease Cas9 [Treponema sp.]|nr:type II CRISPR RNA-guided endonuclease Cas9 [Treponema sp.]